MYSWPLNGYPWPWRIKLQRQPHALHPLPEGSQKLNTFQPPYPIRDLEGGNTRNEIGSRTIAMETALMHLQPFCQIRPLKLANCERYYKQ